MRTLLMPLAGPPQDLVRLPGAVLEVAKGRSIEPIWLNQVGGLTFRLASEGDGQYLKWAPSGSPVDLELEREKLEWAISYTPVPGVVDSGADAEGMWLLMEEIRATNAVSTRWKADPEKAVIAIGRGLRAMHDSLPVDECRFFWSTERRIATIKMRAERGLLDPKKWSHDFQGLTVDQALAKVEAKPETDSLVVCHGDACAPNTLLNDRGDWVAHVDLEKLGVGDRWADLAIAAWSTEWNFGRGWEQMLYESYGLEPDEDRIQYFRLLWDVG